jgi:tetratricopeptide (TPR) repeat protein
MSRVHYARLQAGIAVPRGSTVGLMCQAFNKPPAALGYPHLSLEEDHSLLLEPQMEIVAAAHDMTPELHQREASHGSIPIFKPQQPPPFDEGQLPSPDYFVGRLDDLEWVMRQMREGHTTAITALNGLGGIGKTTLAAVVVHKLREEGAFPDGIAVVLCIGLTDAVDVLRRVLARFDPQRRQPETSDLATLYEGAYRLLKGKRALIVLDNVEPGLDIGRVVAPLKSAGATLLLTSRQALSRAAVPVGASRLLELLPSEDALELFARSLGYNSAEDLSSKERQAAGRIVAVLDRHTLAVKLAGAYTADLKLDLEVFARNLEQDPLDVPEGEMPRAMALAFSQSTVALSPDAQRLFAALASFATPAFSRNAALALAKELGLAMPKQSVDLLVLRALVQASVDEGMPIESDRERLRLHPLLRAFAAENFQLWTEEDRDCAYHAVALYYVSYFNRTTDKALSVDEANIIGALEWAHHHAQDELVATLCAGMQSFWLYRLRMSASQVFLPWGVAAAQAIAERTGTRADRLRAADLSLTYGQMLRYTGRVDEAEAVLEQNLTVRREVEDRRGEEEVLSALGQLYRRSGRTALAEQYFLEALTILQQVSNRRSEGLVRLRLARIARRQGRQEEAKRYIDQALTIDRETQNAREEALALVVSGQFAHDHGQLAEAESLYQEALVLARDVKDPLSETIALNWLGRLAQDYGRLEEAERFYQQSLAIVREVRNRLGESVLMVLWGQLTQARSEIKEAERYYEQSLTLAREVHDRRGEGTALLCLGRLAQVRGELEQARDYYARSLSIAQGVLDRRIEGIALGLQGELAQKQGQTEEAKQYYEQSLAIAREIEDQRSEGRVVCLLGTRAEAEGRIEEAKQCYEQNLAIARNVHDRRGEGLAHFHLGQVLSLRGEMESAEGSFRRALDLLRGQETITYAEAALVFGSFLMRLGNRHKEGCEFIAESIRLSVQMELPGHKEASARAVQFGCGEPRSVGDCRS